MVRLLLLIKISFLLLLTGCSDPYIMPAYDGHIQVNIETSSKIQQGWEEFSKQKTRVRGWARWYKVGDKNYCHIHVPPLNSMEAASTWRHEIRHCIEGQYHDKTLGPISNSK